MSLVYERHTFSFFGPLAQPNYQMYSVVITNNNILVNLHRSTRTNEYAGMQMFFTTNLKRDWSTYCNTYLLSKTKTRANENLICIIVYTRQLHHTRQLKIIRPVSLIRTLKFKLLLFCIVDLEVELSYKLKNIN